MLASVHDPEALFTVISVVESVPSEMLSVIVSLSLFHARAFTVRVASPVKFNAGLVMLPWALPVPSLMHRSPLYTFMPVQPETSVHWSMLFVISVLATSPLQALSLPPVPSHLSNVSWNTMSCAVAVVVPAPNSPTHRARSHVLGVKSFLMFVLD